MELAKYHDHTSAWQRRNDEAYKENTVIIQVHGRGGMTRPQCPTAKNQDLTPYCHRAGTLLPQRTCLWFIATSYNNLLSLQHHCIASVMALVHCYGPFQLLTRSEE